MISALRWRPLLRSLVLGRRRLCPHEGIGFAWPGKLRTFHNAIVNQGIANDEILGPRRPPIRDVGGVPLTTPKASQCRAIGPA